MKKNSVRERRGSWRSRHGWVGLAVVVVVLTAAGCNDSSSPKTDGTVTKDGAVDAVTADSVLPADHALIADHAKGKDGTRDTPAKDTIGSDTVAPSHSYCQSPKTLTLAGGKVEISDSTFDAANEFLDRIDCLSGLGRWTGGQLYYKVALTAGKSYQIAMTPQDADLEVYAFPAKTNCNATAINAACRDHWSATPSLTGGTAERLLIDVTTSEDWIIVVGGPDTFNKGDFTLLVEEYTPPANQTCATAQTITLNASGDTVVKGNTLGSKNEFTNALTCGLTGKDFNGNVIPTPLVGPQVYYKVQLTANVRYRILARTEFLAKLALFRGEDNCEEAKINADCKSGGMTGGVLSVGNLGAAGEGNLFFTPTATGTFYLVVDSTSRLWSGPYELRIAKYEINTFTAPFNFDFEGGKCQAFAATFDWECGDINFKAGPNCTFGSKTFGTPPTAGHSGKGMWGTKLNDCYTPLNNNATVEYDDKATPPVATCTNKDLADDSTLIFNVAVPAGWTEGTLSFWSYEDMNSPWDYAELRLDGKLAWQLCELPPAAGTTPPAPAWKLRTISLTPYVGKTVEVSFRFMASGNTNFAGWYVDDLSVTGK